MPELESIPFATILAALLDTQKPFPPQYLHRLSDLPDEHAAELARNWKKIPVDRRQNILVDLSELVSSETLVCFDDVAKIAMADDDSETRRLAIQLVVESEDYRIAQILIRLMKSDPDGSVRAQAAAALGNFVYLGEVEDISTEKYERILSALLAVMRGAEPAEIQQNALCSLGFSAHEDVPDLIQQAFDRGDRTWKIAALTAMGHSADDQWAAPVLNFLHSDDHDLKVAAIQAAGELELSDARSFLIKLIKTEQDEEIRDAAILALSKIGGKAVRAELEKLLQSAEDDEDAEFLEEALDELDFSTEFSRDGLMNVEEPDEDDMDSFLDVEEDTGMSDEDED